LVPELLEGYSFERSLLGALSKLGSRGEPAMILTRTRAHRCTCLLSLVVLSLGAACSEEQPEFAPRGQQPSDAGIASGSEDDEGKDDDNYQSMREGDVPDPASSISKASFAKMLDEVAAAGYDIHDPAKLCVGWQNSCVLDLDGKVHCWGGNAGMQNDVPPDLPPLVQITCGIVSVCGLDETGKIWCWGLSVPPPEGTWKGITSFSGGLHTCAWKESGEAECFVNDSGEFVKIGGDGAAQWANGQGKPMPVPPGLLFSQISAGPKESCGILKDSGEITCWSDCLLGPDACPANQAPPQGAFVEVVLGASHKCARSADGQVTCWGMGDQEADLDACDNPRWENCTQSTPPPLPEGVVYERLTAGSANTCAMRSDYTAICWGWDLRMMSSVPQTENFTQLVASTRHTCAIRTNGTLTCWGETTNGRIGVPAELGKLF
jgi:hypothetical protein